MSKLPLIRSTRTSNNNTEIDSINASSTPTQNEVKDEQNLILPNINLDNNDRFKNPLVINTKITQLETKHLALEQHYEYVLNKITQDEIKLNYLENKQNNLIQDNNSNNFFANNPNISIKQTLPPPPLNDSSSLGREIGIINNKIKYIEQILKNDQEIRASEKQKELDFNKSLLNKINSSLTNTIQLEVEQRFKADLMQKNSNMKEIDALQRQINGLKTQFEQMQENLLKKIEENNNECSERNQNLAKYVDIKLDDEKINKDSKELKRFIEQLTDQIKNNMNNQNLTNEYSEKKIKLLEEKLSNSIKEIYDFLGKIELRLANKIKYLKKYFEINTLNNNNLIESNIKSIVNNLEKNMGFLAGELVSIQNNTIIEFQNIHKSMKLQNQALLTDLENLLKHQTQLENIMLNRYNEMENIYKNFYNRIAAVESKLEINLTNERILRNCENDNIKKEIKTVTGNMSNTNQVLFNDLNKLIQENSSKNEKINKKFKKIENDIIKNNHSISKIEVDLNETLTKVILNEITQIAVEENTTQELNKVKLFEQSIRNNREDINKLNDRIVDAFKSLGGISKQGDKINDMIKEKEIRDDVEKIMMRMLDECSILEIKEESFDKINSLSNRMRENNEKQENNVKEIKNEMVDLNNQNEEKIKILEQNINNALTGSNINKSVSDMITNAEIEHLYEVVNNLNKNKKTEGTVDEAFLEKVIKQIEENNNVTKKALADYSDIIDNKVNKTLEKVKQDNIDMWTNSIYLAQKMNSPEEIKKLIKEVPPVIVPLDETLQKIMDLTFKYQNPKPFIPDLYENEKQIDEENFGKIIFEDKDKDKELDKDKNKDKDKDKSTEKASNKSKKTKSSDKSKKSDKN